jgi:hypothetical protein
LISSGKVARLRTLPGLVHFEFIADDGSINEVDLLVFTPWVLSDRNQVTPKGIAAMPRRG